MPSEVWQCPECGKRTEFFIHVLDATCPQESKHAKGGTVPMKLVRTTGVQKQQEGEEA